MSEFMITINGQQVSAAPGMTVLEAARSVGIGIPTLCYHPDLPTLRVCRVCLLEIEKELGSQHLCSFTVREGMVIQTHSPAVRKARKTVVELLLSDHPSECTSCARNGSC